MSVSADYSPVQEVNRETVSEGVSAGDFDDLAGEHSRLPACQKQDRLGDVFRLNQASHRDQRRDGLFQIGVVTPQCNTGRGCG